MKKNKGKRIKEYPWKPINIKGGMSEQRLALFGMVTLAWNDLEGALDAALGVSLVLPEPMWVEVTSRINGFGGKVAVLKQTAKLVHKMPEEHIRVIADTLGAAEEHKKYRDGVIHAKILDPDSATAPTYERQGNVGEILVTEEALDGLYNRLGWIRAEIDVIATLFDKRAFLRLHQDAKDFEDEKQAAAQELKACIPLLQERQRQRLALPPLPKMPEEPPTPPNSAEPQWPPG